MQDIITENGTQYTVRWVYTAGREESIEFFSPSVKFARYDLLEEHLIGCLVIHKAEPQFPQVDVDLQRPGKIFYEVPKMLRENLAFIESNLQNIAEWFEALMDLSE